MNKRKYLNKLCMCLCHRFVLPFLLAVSNRFKSWQNMAQFSFHVKARLSLLAVLCNNAITAKNTDAQNNKTTQSRFCRNQKLGRVLFCYDLNRTETGRKTGRQKKRKDTGMICLGIYKRVYILVSSHPWCKEQNIFLGHCLVIIQKHFVVDLIIFFLISKYQRRILKNHRRHSGSFAETLPCQAF